MKNIELIVDKKKFIDFLSVVGKDFSQQVVIKWDFKNDKISLFSGTSSKTFVIYVTTKISSLIISNGGDTSELLYMPLLSIQKSLKLMSQFKKDNTLSVKIVSDLNKQKIDEAVKVELHSKNFEVSFDMISTSYISAPSDQHINNMLDITSSFVKFKWDFDNFNTIQDLVNADGRPDVNFFSKEEDLWFSGKSFKSKLCEGVIKKGTKVALGIETSYLLTISDKYQYDLHIIGEDEENYLIFHSKHNDMDIKYGCGAKI